MSAMTTQEQTGVQSGRMNDVPDPQVPERARRRTYTAKYKRDVLAEHEACDRAGKGALPRRESLYTSLISAWHASARPERWRRLAAAAVCAGAS